ncbi:hypothetical protein [Ectopseudomonas alcaliphila]|nr:MULTISPECIES: hypothetical protein [Pseudomonas]MDP9942726.1 hypothetical protein [Pseudomonas sp. 3400]MDR7014936.1 hypothetical protein [Pseudomonas alcaliphila]
MLSPLTLLSGSVSTKRALRAAIFSHIAGARPESQAMLKDGLKKTS